MLLGLALFRDPAADPWPDRAVAIAPGDDGSPATLLVLDGDTLVLPDGRRVRLLGVDTPEVGRPEADAATDFSARFLAGRRIDLDPELPGKDRYGRLLADVLAEGQSLSRALASAGLAWVYITGDDDLLAAQSAAVDERRGVHGRPSTGPFVVTEGRFHDGSCALVRRRLRELPLAASSGELFRAGRSPCRSCLAWPPLVP